MTRAFVNYNSNDNVKMDLTVYLRHAAIQERNSYNMGKVGIFRHILP